ncbi:MAG: carbohydrate kinase family protein [Rhizobiaceae bacterium]|nr:carbohydrate kinase family protein [Rhizobiaceae bacterium]
MSTIDVLCIGDLDVDMFVSVSRIPGFDQKVAGASHGQMPGGMSANCAVALARLGLKSRLLAAVGSDDAGSFAVDRIRGEGVDVDHLVHLADTSTFMCIVLLSPSGEKSLIKLETQAYLPKPGNVQPAVFDGVRHLHMTFGDPQLAMKSLELAGERGISTSLDLEPPDILRNPNRLMEVLPFIDTLFLNGEAFDMASEALGEDLGEKHLRAGGEIIVTLGATGCRRIWNGGCETVAGFPVASVDTTGAGDCFAGAYLAARLSGTDPTVSMAFANAAAALATLAVGAQTAMPDRAAVADFLARQPRGEPDQANSLQGGEMHA